MSDTDVNEQVARRLVDLAHEDPDTARAAIAGALSELGPPGLAASLIEAIERHAPASGRSGPR